MNRARYIIFALILFLSALLPTFGQDAWYINKEIEDIEFEGLYMISESELEGITDSYIGKKFNDDTFMELQNKLFALDFFEDMTSAAYPGREDISKYDPENLDKVQAKIDTMQKYILLQAVVGKQSMCDVVTLISFNFLIRGDKEGVYN